MKKICHRFLTSTAIAMTVLPINIASASSLEFENGWKSAEAQKVVAALKTCAQDPMEMTPANVNRLYDQFFDLFKESELFVQGGLIGFRIANICDWSLSFDTDAERIKETESRKEASTQVVLSALPTLKQTFSPIVEAFIAFEKCLPEPTRVRLFKHAQTKPTSEISMIDWPHFLYSRLSQPSRDELGHYTPQLFKLWSDKLFGDKKHVKQRISQLGIDDITLLLTSSDVKVYDKKFTVLPNLPENTLFAVLSTPTVQDNETQWDAIYDMLTAQQQKNYARYLRNQAKKTKVQ